MPDLPPAKEDLKGYIGIYEESVRVSFIGESTVAGVGTDTHKSGLAGRVSAKLASHYKKQVHWQVDGRVGYTKEQVIRDILPNIDLSESNLVIIAIGGNDSFALTPPSKWYYLSRKLIDKIKNVNPTIKICFASLPPTHQFPSFNKPMRGFVGGQTKILSKTLSQTVEHYGSDVSFLDEPVDFHEYKNRAPEGTQLKDLFSDGYHPSTITYDLWADDIVNHLSHIYSSI